VFLHLNNSKSPLDESHNRNLLGAKRFIPISRDWSYRQLIKVARSLMLVISLFYTASIPTATFMKQLWSI